MSAELASHFMFALKLPEKYAGRPTFSIRNKRSGVELGSVGWSVPWRCFCFSPSSAATVFNNDCLRSIAEFCTALGHDDATIAAVRATKEGS